MLAMCVHFSKNNQSLDLYVLWEHTHTHTFIDHFAVDSNEEWFGDDGNLTMSRYGQMNGTHNVAIYIYLPSAHSLRLCLCPRRSQFNIIVCTSMTRISGFGLCYSLWAQSIEIKHWPLKWNCLSQDSLPVYQFAFAILLCWLLRFDIKIISILKRQPDFTANHKSVCKMLNIVGWTSLENFE